MAIIKSKAYSLDQWTEVDVDTILRDGDRIYQLITSKSKLNSEYLLLDDLPSVLEKNIIEKSKPKAGLVNQRITEGPFHHLEGALSSLFIEMPDMDGMLLTVGCSTPSYTGAVISQKQSSTLHFFDPHSRSDTGMSTSDGKATVSSHNSLPALCLFIQHLTSSLFKDVSKVPFEAIAVKIESIGDYQETLDNNSSFSDSSSEFSGFDTVSENELANRLSTLKETFRDADESFSVSEQCLIESDENDDSLLINEAVSGINDSFTLLRTIDTDIIENYCESSEECLSDDSNNDPNYELPKEVNDEGSTDEDVPLSFFSRRKRFYRSKYKDTSDVGQQFKQKEHNVEPSKNVGPNEEQPSDVAQQEKVEMDRTSLQMQQTCRSSVIGLQNPVISEPQTDPNSNTNSKISENEDGSNTYTELDKDEEQIDPGFLERQNRQTGPTNEVQHSESNKENNDSNQQYAEQSSRRGRKRVRNEADWKRNIAKRRKNKGQSYIAKSWKIVKAKVMRKACGDKCKFSCNRRFNEEAREKIFYKFWTMGNITMQRQFLIKFAQKRMKHRGSNNMNNRNCSVKYTLPNLLTGESYRVCKTFFLNTLGISHQMVSTAHMKQDTLPGVINGDRRGSMPGSRSNKLPEEKLAKVREHISSFPTIESHYCRKDSSRKYLDPDLSLKKMYKLYCEKCSDEGMGPVKLHKYRKIFNTEFNLGFYQPISDQCDFCTRYKNATACEREKIAKDYENHIKNKELSRESKSKDKERSKTEKDLVVACFDLQQVLLTPKGFESSLYYKRRLNTYNFSIYDYETADGFCYVWNESISGRGANEMASCVFDFIEKYSKAGKKRFIFYSDNCSSQNKNKFYISMLWYALNKFSIRSIEHKYLIAGHTQNENDSVHATIEYISRKKKSIPLSSGQPSYVWQDQEKAITSKKCVSRISLTLNWLQKI